MARNACASRHKSRSGGAIRSRELACVLEKTLSAMHLMGGIHQQLDQRGASHRGPPSITFSADERYFFQRDTTRQIDHAGRERQLVDVR